MIKHPVSIASIRRRLSIYELETRETPSFGAIGTEQIVTSGNSAYNSVIASDAVGNTVVVWQSNDSSGLGIYARRYNSNGVAYGNPFRVNTYTPNDQINPTVAMDTDGDFVIAWQSSEQDGNEFGVYAQRYNDSGDVQGSEFQVNSYTLSSQINPTVAIDADGDFVITWQSNEQDGNGFGVYAQRYSSVGLAQNGEFQVNSYTLSSQTYPVVSMDADGDFVIAWESFGQDGFGAGIYAQRYNALGFAQGTEFQVNTFTTFDQANTAIAMNCDGNFVISWSCFGQDGSGVGVYAQRFNSAGIAQGSEFQVNTYTNNHQVDPSIAIDTNGNFIITWQSYGQDGSSSGIYAQRFMSYGDRNGPEFQVNTSTLGVQTYPNVTMNSRGDITIVWDGYRQNVANNIFMQQYTDNTAPTFNMLPASISIDEMSPYSITIGATDTDVGQPLTYGLVNPPDGASINPITGIFTWTPSETQGPDVYGIQFTTTDGLETTTKVITFNVREVNSTPSLDNVPLTATLVRGVPFTFTAYGTDFDMPTQTLTYSLVGAPTGAFINPDTGVFSWTPSGSTELGDYTFLVRLTDDGTASRNHSVSTTLSVEAVSLNAGNLIIGGTSNADKIVVRPSIPSGLVNVFFGNQLLGSVPKSSITGIIQVSSLDGNDRITIDPKLTIHAELLGGSGNDTLYGGIGHDTLDGGTGNDLLYGRAGNDQYRFSNNWGRDSVRESSGLDLMNYAAITTPIQFTKTGSATMGINTVSVTGMTESLIGGAGNDTLSTVSGTNIIHLTFSNSGIIGAVTFNSVENIVGGSGIDTLRMQPTGSLSGTFNGGLGRNILDYSTWTSDVTVNLKLNKATALGSLTNVFNVLTGSGNDLLVGNDLANFFSTGLGRDVLIGALGADTLTGGDGDDQLIAGFTSYDFNEASLDTIRTSWTANNTYSIRIANLQALAGLTFTKDTVKDSLTGGTGDDWFISSTGDILKDKLAGETLTTVT